MEIIFKARQTDVPERFRDQATAKLEKLEKLDQKTIRVDVEVSVERNPRLASQKERVELTIISRGPVIRAEAAAEDRFAALDLALAKLDSRLRRALSRRKRHHAGLDRVADRVSPSQLVLPEDTELPAQRVASSGAAVSAPAGEARARAASKAGRESAISIDADGDGPLVVRQKFHHARPIPIDQALLEMELVGHDFYLFHDIESGMPSVVYRRRGYQYGVIRLVEDPARAGRPETGKPETGKPETGRTDRSRDLARQDASASAARSG
jgi:ribosomal subunit interface protein